MSDVIRVAIARDGSTFEFVDGGAPSAKGGLKDVYFSPDKSYAVAFYRKPLEPIALRRLEKIVGEYRYKIFEERPNEGRYWLGKFSWPEKIVEWNGRVGFTTPIYPPEFFFSSGRSRGKEKKCNWFAASKIFNCVLAPEEKASLEDFLHVCLRLSAAIRRLHAAGLAHSDLSYNNVLVSPRDRAAHVIDLDGLVVPELYPPDVLGSPDFTAPEVVKTRHLPLTDPERELPCRETDRHALAVMLYLLLFHRHPLRGNQFFSEDPNEQDRLEMGSRSLFIEHPTDPSNRRTEFPPRETPWCDPSAVPYEIAGPELAPLFRQAFVDGLHDPPKRPTAAAWETAFAKTLDLILPCSNPDCVKKSFVYDAIAAPKAACPYCGTPYVHSIPILDFFVTRNGVDYLPENRRLVARHNQWLYPWHLYPSKAPNEKLSDDEYNGVAYVAYHRGKWVLVNESAPEIRNLTDDVAVAPKTMVELRDGLELLLSSGAQGRKARVRVANRGA